MESFVGFVGFAIFLYVICFFIAKPMLKKRKLLAKKFLIGEEDPETIYKLELILILIIFFAGLFISIYFS